MKRYRLAPMKGLLLWVTVVVLPLPLLLGWAASAAGTGLMWIPAVFVGLVYLFVWFYMRPTAFDLTPTSLDIVWPVRRQTTPLNAITSAESMSGAEFRRRYGIGYRIGAGGLWGGFGLYKTKTVMFQFYISRMDDYVVVERANDRPLLITPDNPDHFAAQLSAAVSEGKTA